MNVNRRDGSQSSALPTKSRSAARAWDALAELELLASERFGGLD